MAIALLTNDKVAVMVRVGGSEMGARCRTVGWRPATMVGRDIRYQLISWCYTSLRMQRNDALVNIPVLGSWFSFSLRDIAIRDHND